jgi:Fe-S-cluster-containing dehydrogenase component
VPNVLVQIEQMMKCDLCFDRTSVGKKPMCATVCPSQALSYVPAEEIARTRRETPVNTFVFGRQTVRTLNFMMAPAGLDRIEVDVVDYMWEDGR